MNSPPPRDSVSLVIKRSEVNLWQGLVSGSFFAPLHAFGVDLLGVLYLGPFLLRLFLIYFLYLEKFTTPILISVFLFFIYCNKNFSCKHLIHCKKTLPLFTNCKWNDFFLLHFYSPSKEFSSFILIKKNLNFTTLPEKEFFFLWIFISSRRYLVAMTWFVSCCLHRNTASWKSLTNQRSPKI